MLPCWWVAGGCKEWTSSWLLDHIPSWTNFWLQWRLLSSTVRGELISSVLLPGSYSADALGTAVITCHLESSGSALPFCCCSSSSTAGVGFCHAPALSSSSEVRVAPGPPLQRMEQPWLLWACPQPAMLVRGSVCLRIALCIRSRRFLSPHLLTWSCIFTLGCHVNEQGHGLCGRVGPEPGQRPFAYATVWCLLSHPDLHRVENFLQIWDFFFFSMKSYKNFLFILPCPPTFCRKVKLFSSIHRLCISPSTDPL